MVRRRKLSGKPRREESPAPPLDPALAALEIDTEALGRDHEAMGRFLDALAAWQAARQAGQAHTVTDALQAIEDNAASAARYLLRHGGDPSQLRRWVQHQSEDGFNELVLALDAESMRHRLAVEELNRRAVILKAKREQPAEPETPSPPPPSPPPAPPHPTDERHAEPTREYCLPAEGVIRWATTKRKVPPRLWHLLDYVLRQGEQRATYFELRRHVYKNHNKTDQSIANDIAAANGILLEVGQPWRLKSVENLGAQSRSVCALPTV
jgi:hypothetical protein